MKRIVISILTALTVGAAAARADEGMWLLPLLQKMNAEAMADLGCRLSAEQIYSINHSSLKDAVVQFGGGCTGEIISDEGLLVTNHHCGYSSIQSLSTVEHNYLEDGFWAMNRGEEIPVPGLTVKFLQSMTDITPIMRKLEKKSEEERNKAIGKLIEDAAKDVPGSTAIITDFYNSNATYLIVYKIYSDVRFVGAPPASCGKFGGETDNWMWPRHTCDFSMFRVYAGKDNQPADYSPDNIPLKPRQSLKVSLKGYDEGDFAMIMGYPGSTQRFQTAAQLQKMIDVNSVRIAARTVRQDVLWKEMRADDKVSLQYASKYASSSNGWKKWQGMELAFDKLGIIARERQQEEELGKWIDSKAARQKKYAGALSTIDSIAVASTASSKAYTLLSESLGRIELLTLSRMSDNAMYKDYDAGVDRKVAKAMAEFYLANVEPQDRVDADLSPEAVDALFDGSIFTSADKKESALAEGYDKESDPATVLLAKVRDKALSLSQATSKDIDRLQEASRTYTEAMLDWKKGQPSYPDANMTCRLTYGSVRSYSPKDGVLYRHYTTLKGVMEKEDPDNYEFRVPSRLKDIYEAGDFGRYANDKGEVPACFLVNCDITGGNSGSPVMDADGALIGLAFDGNWESMSSDVMFEPDLQRCICVDIRYVLLMMDKFGGASYLLDEMNLVE